LTNLCRRLFAHVVGSPHFSTSAGTMFWQNLSSRVQPENGSIDAGPAHALVR
jgi:hypothetical protein